MRDAAAIATPAAARPWQRVRPPWRRPEIESGPLYLTSRRLYILPTRLGLVFALLLAGLLLAAINYAVSLGYLFTFLMGGIALVGMLHTQRNLLHLSLRPATVAPVFAGERARFCLHVDNPDGRLRGALRLEHPDGTSAEADLPGRGSTTLALDLTQRRRGYHRPGRLILASTWPLGLFRCWTVFELDWGVLVYPAPAPEPLPLPAAQGGNGRHSAMQAGDDDFCGLRSYHPGDSLRRVAWKTAARGLPPMTKQFAGEDGDELWLDWSTTPERDSEARLCRLTRWALDAERGGRIWGLRLPARAIPPNRGEAHLHAALEALARHGEA